ncbi:MAG: substrate-binding domain-containing protein [Anaerolineaceae bacterium]|nr:substrate-binding domain-containing protein [Anaerolineaceae bacterium]
MHVKVLKLVGKLFLAGVVLGVALSPMASVKAESTCSNINDPNCLYVWGSTTNYPWVQVSETRFFPENSGTFYNIDGTHSSGYGQSYLMSGQADIASSSGTCNDANGGLNGAGAAIHHCADFTDNVIGRDAVSIMVNNSLTCVTSLTKAQLQGIYEHTITNWNQLNASCPSHTIDPYARAIGSGTRSSFIKLAALCVDAGDPDTSNASACITGGSTENATIAATTVTRKQASPDMEAAVDGDQYGIGYVGLAFFDTNIHPLSLDFGSGPVSPSDATVSNGTYPMSRNLHLFTLTSGSKALAQTYVQWVQSPEGQAAVVDQGFVAIAKAAPDWDVNLDGKASIADIATIGNFWGSNNSVPGWIRADVNQDGKISIADVATVGNFWGKTWS